MNKIYLLIKGWGENYSVHSIWSTEVKAQEMMDMLEDMEEWWGLKRYHIEERPVDPILDDLEVYTRLFDMGVIIPITHFYNPKVLDEYLSFEPYEWKDEALSSFQSRSDIYQVLDEHNFIYMKDMNDPIHPQVKSIKIEVSSKDRDECKQLLREKAYLIRHTLINNGIITPWS